MKNFSIETICETDNMFLPRRMVWSPDDSLLLLSSFCNEVRIIDSSLNTNLEKTFPRMVTDIVWYPGMRIENRASWAFASVCPHYPIELIDAGDGHQRGAYICQSGSDSTASLTCLAFCGASILAGCSRCIFSCDIVRQDRKGSMAAKFSGTALSIGCHPTAGVLASGTSTGDALLLDSRSFQQVCSWHPWRGSHGIDSVVWADENLLLCSARLEDTVCALDVWQPSSAVRSRADLFLWAHLGRSISGRRVFPALPALGTRKGPQGFTTIRKICNVYMRKMSLLR